MTNRRYISLFRNALRRVLTTLWVCMAVMPAKAFAPDFYAESSALASGRWVKVAVEQSGLHMIPVATLRSWGFTDPARVRVHGYGGRRIADVLSEENYIDDLPEVASELTAAGLVFYAAGPDRWVLSTGQYYHQETNLYSTRGYYFLTESDAPAAEMPVSGRPGADSPAREAYGRVHHEIDRVQASEAGPAMVGEDFRYQSSRNFDFATPARVDGSPVWFECQFVHSHEGASAELAFTADGKALDAVTSDRISATSSSQYVHGSVGNTRHTFTPAGTDRFVLGVTYKPSRIATMANLDYISVNYTRRLELDAAGTAEFWSSGNALAFDAGGADVRVWDVTTPHSVERINTEKASDGTLRWQPSRQGVRNYVAWRPGASMPAPVRVGNVANQDFHAPSASPAGMIIFSDAAYTAQAERVAALHRRTDGMEVAVVDPEKIYNEFSSGVPDVSGIRKYLKMLYDRGQAPAYVLLMGRTTLDHRGLLPNTERLAAGTVPWWVTNAVSLSMSDNSGYGTDDFIAMLDDGSGRDHGKDPLRVAVGRIPLLSAADGDEIIDKLCQYVDNSRKSAWKNRLLVLADDEDNSVHLRQADKFVHFADSVSGRRHIIDKVYIDAYEKVAGTYPEARSKMMRALEEGVTWWYFTGHANNHSWTADGMLSYTDINTMYLRNVPFVVAATCDFLRWDSETISGGEIMYKERNGGAIGMISATRPVYISDNEYILSAFGRHTLERDDDGRFLTVGEVYRRAKNDLLKNGVITSNPNRHLYVLMGDPALRLGMPDNTVEILTIDGRVPDPDAEVTIPAMGTPEIKGRITGPDGQLMADFNGVVTLEIFDAETTLVTKGHGDTGSVEVFDTNGDKLYAGSATVQGGYFTLRAAMPGMVADNFRPAFMSMYAYATDSDAEAVGGTHDFYVYGFDDKAPADTEAPAIESMFLNHSGFTSGDQVNASPMLIASVSDNVGINLSTAGVGHRMVLTLDDFTTFTDVSSFYTPASDGTASGVINYPLDYVDEGSHSLRLRVFDTSGNMAERTVQFTVNPGLAPQIFDVFTDANPATDHANFYVRHDRPENIVEVGITVYNLLGRPLWSSTAKGMSDSDISTPVSWDLCDAGGRRVPRGIYLYRATITTDTSEHYETASRRIAVR